MSDTSRPAAPVPMIPDAAPRAHPAPRSAVPPPPADLLPRLLQILAGLIILRPFTRFCYRVEVLRSRVVHPGPVVYACNHRSFFDPPLVGMCAVEPISYFARASLWSNPFIGSLLRIMYGIPVDRDQPGVSSMKGAVERLRRGISVLVFPEGTRTRSGWLGPLHDGPALFARRAGVPIVPVYITGSDRAWPRGAILPRLGVAGLAVRFGRPMHPPAGLSGRAQDAWVSHRLQLWMQVQEARYRRAPIGSRSPAPGPARA